MSKKPKKEQLVLPLTTADLLSGLRHSQASDVSVN